MKGVPRRMESTFDKVRLLMNVLPVSLTETSHNASSAKFDGRQRGSKLFQKNKIGVTTGRVKRGSVGV